MWHDKALQKNLRSNGKPRLCKAGFCIERSFIFDILLFHLLLRPDQHLPCTCVCTGIQQPNRIRDFEQEHGEIDLHDISKL